MRKVIIKFKLLEKNINFWFILTVSFLFSLLRLPSLIEPDWYGDEGIYQVVGMAMRRGALLYRDIWDNKPPLLYVIYAIFDGNLFYTKLLSLIFGVFAVIAFFYLAKRIFKSKKALYISTIFFALLFGLPLLEGNIANAENFMLFPIIFALYLILYSNNKRKYLISGLLLSAAFLLKIVAVFDFAAFLLIILISKSFEDFSIINFFRNIIKSIKRKSFVKIYKDEIVFILSFFAPIVLVTSFFLFKGIIADYFKAVLSQNVGYVGYGNYFLFPMGFLLLKLVILLSVFLVIVRYRRSFGVGGFAILTWLLFSIFNAQFSERPYTHYLLVLLPALSLFIGYLIETKKLLYINSMLLLFILFIIAKNFHVYGKITSYYFNYVSFVSGKESVESYQSFFDRRVPYDYDIVDFIKANTKDSDNIFLWSDSAQIYALSNKLPPGRYAVAYHITFYKDGIEKTKENIQIKKPKYIISTKDSQEITNFIDSYKLRYNLKGAKVYERQI